jgi:hypothetical protein
VAWEKSEVSRDPDDVMGTTRPKRGDYSGI